MTLFLSQFKRNDCCSQISQKRNNLYPIFYTHLILQLTTILIRAIRREHAHHHHHQSHANSAHLLSRQRVESLTNFGERALSQLPPDQVVADPLGVVKVPYGVGGGTSERHRDDVLSTPGGGRGGLPLVQPVAVHHHVAVRYWHNSQRQRVTVFC